jgi:hypothetical protein
VTKPLTDQLRAAIAWADPQIPHGRLAELLGVTYAQVRFTRRRVWRDGLVCRIYWVTCTHCGGLIAAASWATRYHPTCLAAAIDRDDLAATSGPVIEHESGTASTAQQRYYQNHPDRARIHVQRQLSRDATQQRVTAAAASRSYEPWTADEDAQVIECAGRAQLEHVALTIGRTFISVRNRRDVLRARNRAQASNAPSHNSSESSHTRHQPSAISRRKP